MHLIDTVLREGRPVGPLALPDLPAIPGREVAGVVDAVGPQVDERWLGRRVVAHLGPASGGYAELAVRETQALHALPDGLADDAAVAMIGTGRTALAVLEVAQLTRDDVVLVTAAAGGLGSLLVQAARNAGATVVGAAGGPAKVDRVVQLGAGVGVDYSAPRWSDAVREALGGRAVTVSQGSAMATVRAAPIRIATRTASMARTMPTTYLSLGAFYAADRHRATSRERDVGLWWRADGPLARSYRAAFVEATGELYVMQHEGMRGGGMVQVLGRFDSFAELHRVVAGWEDVCGEAGSIDWLLARVGRVLAADAA